MRVVAQPRRPRRRGGVTRGGTRECHVAETLPGARQQEHPVVDGWAGQRRRAWTLVQCFKNERVIFIIRSFV